jgi:hypothetical protein
LPQSYWADIYPSGYEPHAASSILNFLEGDWAQFYPTRNKTADRVMVFQTNLKIKGRKYVTKMNQQQYTGRYPTTFFRKRSKSDC